jgi:hypothetical protein
VVDNKQGKKAPAWTENKLGFHDKAWGLLQWELFDQQEICGALAKIELRAGKIATIA